ncbi:MAG: sporulation inhibitor of replication protein SirA [Bacilli bacterium]|nr:sporulation inhibitor of replication protein SirA [Bacilli bacterium]
MKVYFIFEVKDEFKKLYKGNERILFSILKQLYYLDKSELMYGYNLFSQLTNGINKRQLDQKIFIELHQEIPYSKRNQIHYINNLYKNEISRLEIKRTYIKLEIEQEQSTFFKILENYSSNLFACDFSKQDYFFITNEETISI